MHRGQRGEEWTRGSILLRYSSKNGDLFVRSCASVLRVCLSKVSSVLLTVGGICLIILLFCLFVRYVFTACVCDCLRACLMAMLLVRGLSVVRCLFGVRKMVGFCCRGEGVCRVRW